MQKDSKTQEFAKLKRLIKVCKNANVNRIKYENIEIEFKDDVKGTKPTKYETDKTSYLDNSAIMPPDDVMMFAAVTASEQMMLDRKAAQKKG